METIAMLGETISHYKIIEKLGEGGMGIVYKAQDLTLDRFVALKFLPHDLIRDPDAKERFVHEAQAASALDHANICTVHEIGQHDGQTFIVMGYYEGETLKRKIEHGALPFVDAVNLICQVAEGLAKAHEAGIVHRDIKPANIIVTKDGVAKILDFGLAKVSGRTLHTKSGTTLGTVAYMSPEQARGEEIDARSDVWSLGVTLYELLSGKRPFESGYEQALVYLILNERPEPLEKQVPDLAPEVLAIVNRALEKKPDARYPSAGEMLADLRTYQETLRGEAFSMKTVLRWARTPKIAIPAFTGLIGIVLLTVWFFNRQAKIQQAREVFLPAVARLVAENDFYRNLTAPYDTAVEAEKYISDDPKLAELFSKCSATINVTTIPPGARVYSKEYRSPESEWKFLGISPLQKIRMPATVIRWKFEKDGYETVLAASSTFDLDSMMSLVPANLVRILDTNGTLPPGMVRVQATNTDVGKLDDFFIDRYEVTNKQYKQFITAGGYKDKKYWRHKFSENGKELTWEQAMNKFVDHTGQRAPSSWQGGDFPEGQGDYPVSGVSWYEAAAYAEFVGKNLPTSYHWNVAQGAYTMFTDGAQLFAGEVTKVSNFDGKGPARVGTYPGITAYGAFDMGGNVREWCWNEFPKGRSILGGAWNDNIFALYNGSQRPPMDRSLEHGFRCALYPRPETVPDAAFRFVKLYEQIDVHKAKPVPDAIFQVYKEQFSYDITPLNARVESKEENPEGWILEKITLDAAYGHERFAAYLFLPKNTSPPYQTVIYFPTASAMSRSSSQDIEHFWEFPMFLSFLVKNGRAVLFPVYKGSFERPDETYMLVHANPEAGLRHYTEYLIKVVKDLKRSVDYLETREEIDRRKIAFYGISWGGMIGGIVPAVEERLKASVLLGAGFDPCGRPEACQLNYLPRVKIPTLMLVGQYDPSLSHEDSHEPMYKLLGTPAQDKQMKVYPVSHLPERNVIIKETLAWFDRYVGPVNK